MRLEEPDRRFVDHVHLVRHARTGVDAAGSGRAALSDASKNCTGCATPSSKTAKSPSVSPFTNCRVRSVTVTFSGTRLAPLRKTAGRATAAGGGSSPTAARTPRRKRAAGRRAATPSRAARLEGLRGVSRLPPGAALGASRVPAASSGKTRGVAQQSRHVAPILLIPVPVERPKVCVVASLELLPGVGVALTAEVLERIGGRDAAQLRRRHRVDAHAPCP